MDSHSCGQECFTHNKNNNNNNKKVRVPLCKHGEKNLQFCFEILVSVASDEPTTHNRETHARLNCTPDQDNGTEEAPNASEVWPTQLRPWSLCVFFFFLNPIQILFCFVVFHFSLKVCVDTKSQSSLEYCSAAIYRLAKQTFWLIYTHDISHCPVF